MPLGAIFCSAILLTDPAYKRLDGQCIAIDGVYSQFCAWLISQSGLGNVPTCTIGEYGTELSTYGQCGKFVINTTSEILIENGATIEANSIKLPTITAFIESTNNTYPIGSAKEAGLPNIVGKSTGWLAESVGTNSGALTGTKKGGNNKNATTNGSYWSTSNTINFDASNSNAIYGKSDTVQPKSVCYPCYIIVATGTKTEVEVDINNVLTEVNKVQKRYLVSNWVNSDGSCWYEIYSDGFKKYCGTTGVQKASTTAGSGFFNTINFPFSFSNTNYHVHISATLGETILSSSPAGPETMSDSKTISSVRIGVWNRNASTALPNMSLEYEICGY